jgi:hypothetical protein
VAVQRQEERHYTEQQEQVVVVEVVGDVDELDPRETDEVGDECQPVAIAQRHTHSGDGHHREERVDPGDRWDRHPVEAPEAEEEGGLAKETFDPAVGDKTHRRKGREQPIQDAERDQPGGVDRLG